MRCSDLFQFEAVVQAVQPSQFVATNVQGAEGLTHIKIAQGGEGALGVADLRVGDKGPLLRTDARRTGQCPNAARDS